MLKKVPVRYFRTKHASFLRDFPLKFGNQENLLAPITLVDKTEYVMDTIKSMNDYFIENK